MTASKFQNSFINFLPFQLRISSGSATDQLQPLPDQLRPLLDLKVAVGSDLELHVQLIPVLSLDVLLEHSAGKEKTLDKAKKILILCQQWCCYFVTSEPNIEQGRQEQMPTMWLDGLPSLSGIR